jgi:hypothetical protein
MGYFPPTASHAWLLLAAAGLLEAAWAVRVKSADG